MRKHKKSVGKRILSVLLTLTLLMGLLPAGALAEEAVGSGGRFILTVEANGNLIIAPEYVSYTEGQTIGDALTSSGHVFTIENGMITTIDGVVGNYNRTDEDGAYDLAKPAGEVSFYWFYENEDNKLSDGIKQLMTAIAEYQQKSDDVKAAAKAAYDTAYAQFVGIDEQNAAVLAASLNNAVSSYESSQGGQQYTVTFSDGAAAYAGASIQVTNEYGKNWTDDNGDGVLQLPAGNYSFSINKDGLWAEGSASVAFDMTVTAMLPSQSQWLNLDTLSLSESYDSTTGEYNFADEEYKLGEWNGRSLTVPVLDSFTGDIYIYAETQDPEEVPNFTAIYPSATTGTEVKKDLAIESRITGMNGVLARGAEGNTVTLRVSKTEADGYTYSQDYTLNFTRIPTLAGISVCNQDNVDQAADKAFSSEVTEYTYKVLDAVESIIVKPTPSNADYQVSVNGEVAAAEGVTVDINGETDVQVVVSSGDYTNTYTLKIVPGAGTKYTFITESGVTLQVVNQNGQVMPYTKINDGKTKYQYTLIPGDTYSYVATKDTYYHATDELTTWEDNASTTIEIKPTDWLGELLFGTGTQASKKGDIPFYNDSFQKGKHSYQVQLVDTENNPCVWIKTTAPVKAEAIYEQKFANYSYHGKQKTVELENGKNTGIALDRFLMYENPIENTVTIRLSQEKDGITYYQDYEIEFIRSLTLKNLSAKCGSLIVPLARVDGQNGFSTAVKEYYATVSMAADTLRLDFERYTENKCYGEAEVGYTVEINGEDVTAAGGADITLNGTGETETVTVTVKNPKAPTGTSTYVVHVLKAPPVEAMFNIAPDTAVLALYESVSGERMWPDETGTYQLCEGYSYNYNLTAYGYVAKSGILNVNRDDQNELVVVDGINSYPVTVAEAGGGKLTIDWTLAEAEANTEIDKTISAEWGSFRGNDYNNAVTDAPVPMDAEKGTLYWANGIGEGYGKDAVGSPILVDGDLITYASDNIYRVDTVSGEIKVTGKMDHTSAHATTPPSYADGMVFIALTNGTVQAFNAETLESLWIYEDPLGGQPVCPITIKNGYLYTGFWNYETTDANFVCLSITDEDINKTNEAKCATWYHTAKGGYYWAGAYASDDFVIIGTDDGITNCDGQSSQLLLFHPVTGELLDSIEELNGDIRSTVAYDEETDAYYFTSKGGSFYSVKVKQTEEGLKFENYWEVKLLNGTESIPMSTSSPVVYNGRAYVGVSGGEQFQQYSGHNITVIDLEKKAIAYSVQTKGYPQTSGLLTTAYEEKSGYVYVYFFDNYTPGILRVLRDKEGQKSADYLTVEGVYETSYALFTPTGKQAQYAICSPIVDQYGTIYFKNDSAYMMAFGSSIERIEVTKMPDKTEYADGEKFDPAGMVVTATYANGKTRDVTDYVTYDVDTITDKQTTVTITFPYVMYHNQTNGSAMVSGVNSSTPATTLELTIGGNLAGDVNGDGEVDIFDLISLRRYLVGYDEDINIKNTDIDGEEGIDIFDLIALRKKLVE